ncbi:N-6 DNA methylase [Citrobacter enshiensis]|uniref:N-6 DNA methylase n=1 Tax=Citrobacter enshiensis TaxID=2971264 RepID=UPI0023E83C51|nr:N-6 DNA methylase [Citrobacter enshiensis]WET40734.1 N-6 DNA methylase [Citrobacter enshiensis]
MLHVEKFNEKMCEFIAQKTSVKMLDKEDYSDFLNHEFSDILIRKSFEKDVMRDNGCFFTGTKLAKHLFNEVVVSESNSFVFLDPTCGLGNLLVEASKFLPTEKSLSKTLKSWGKSLVGYDIFPDFIKATKLRIILEALSRGVKNDCSLDIALSLLYRIEKKNVMSLGSQEVKDITHAVLNPPFANWESPVINYWKKGKVNSAGIIIDHLTRIFPKETIILSILPDVLRSGSRYKEFREFIESEICGKVEIWGKFSPKTDVDVFVFKGKKIARKTSIDWNINSQSGEKLEDYYNISTGPLVAYRDPDEGVDAPYLHQKNAPTGVIIDEIKERRKFRGRLTTPPFVVIKRTSSPRDKIRASATLINCIHPVAVENHLIILSPKDNSIEKCIKLLDLLLSEQTTNYLNERIRLRHLTVAAIKEIPFK